jgi:hypothetical protein
VPADDRPDAEDVVARGTEPDCSTTTSITTDDARTTSTLNMTTRSTTNPPA